MTKTFAALAACTILSSIPAGAAIVAPPVLSAPTSEENLFVGNVTKYSTDAGTISGSDSGRGGSESGQATTNLNQSVSASLNYTGIDPVYGAGAKVTAYLTYKMYIYAATDHAVQLNINAQGAGSITDSAVQSRDTQLQSELFITSPINYFFLGFGQDQTINNNNPVVTSFSWSTNQDYTFQTNTPYNIQLMTWVQTQGVNSSASMSAYVDPVFTIDDPNGAQYQLILSPGISNVAPVPEPGEWAMMLAGLAGVGLIARRRKGIAG